MDLGTVSFERTVFLKLWEEVAHHCAADHPIGFLCSQTRTIMDFRFWHWVLIFFEKVPSSPPCISNSGQVNVLHNKIWGICREGCVGLLIVYSVSGCKSHLKREATNLLQLLSFLQLFLFNFYPFIQRFLQPHQRGKQLLVDNSVGLSLHTYSHFLSGAVSR